MKTNKILALITGLFLLSGNALSYGQAASEFKTPLIPVTKDFTLPNGLRVVFSEDHSVPVIAVVIVYDVGARNEQKGKSGFAHLFEHMMFEGSENVGKNQYFQLVEAAGGLVNASTHPDYTNYFEKLPSNQLDLAFWLESDRMRSLKVTEANFKNQLETVKEEKRMRIDNQPYTPSMIKFEEMLFDNWANAHAVIGSFEDLESSSVADVKKFFDTYYVPNNAVMAVVGDFDSTKAELSVRKYFASIPRGANPPKPNVAEPVQTKEKYAKVEDKLAPLPAFWMGFKAPAVRDVDYYPAAMMEKILSNGTSSRLYQRMVKGDQVALQVSAGLDSRRGPSAFEAMVRYKPENSAAKVQGILWEEFEKIKTQPVSEEELQTARNQVLRDLFSSSSYSSLQRSVGRAELLAEYTLFFGNPKLIDEDVKMLLNVKADDIKRVANKIFTKQGMTLVDVVPQAKGANKASLGVQL